MANEITLTASLAFAKGSVASVSRAATALKRDVAGSVYHQSVQDVGFAAEEALSLGDASVGGYCYLKNLDATNFIEVRANTGVADLIRLEPGDVALFRITDDAVPYVQADTAACKLEILLIEA